jgi:hypothetical protein
MAAEKYSSQPARCPTARYEQLDPTTTPLTSYKSASTATISNP